MGTYGPTPLLLYGEGGGGTPLPVWTWVELARCRDLGICMHIPRIPDPPLCNLSMHKAASTYHPFRTPLPSFAWASMHGPPYPFRGLHRFEPLMPYNPWKQRDVGYARRCIRKGQKGRKRPADNLRYVKLGLWRRPCSGRGVEMSVSYPLVSSGGVSLRPRSSSSIWSSAETAGVPPSIASWPESASFQRFEALIPEYLSTSRAARKRSDDVGFSMRS